MVAGLLLAGGFLLFTGLLWRWFRDVAYGGGSGNQIS